MANFMSLEMSEHRFPLRFDYFRLREDSGGAGWHRGGCGTEYGFTVWSDCTVSVLGDRAEHAPFGICGGKSAEANHVEFVTNGKAWLPKWRSKQDKQLLVDGDSLHAASPGGGGYGDPLTRDLADVQLDLNRGYISRATAENVYGVVVGAEHQVITGYRDYCLDEAASIERRRMLGSK
jgi:N-methylhydantoinase B